ncbi:MAG: NPCBM/NEW2 domain-containing protein [Planctomycetota bacterium]
MRSLFVLIFTALALPALAQVSLIDNDGKIRKGRDVLISASGEITILTDGDPFTAKLDEISEIVYEARPIGGGCTWEVHLATSNPRCRDILPGTIEDPTDDSKIRVVQTDAGDIEFPIDFAFALRKCASQLAVPEVAPPVDTVAWSRDNKQDRDKGMLKRLGKDTLELDSELFKSIRTYKLQDVEGVHLAPLNKAVVPEGVLVVVTTRRGLRVTGKVLEMTAKVCRVETTHRIKGKPWELSVQAEKVASIQVMNGNLSYLSDMNPKLLETWRENIENVDSKVSAEGWMFLDRMVTKNAPITIRGKAYRKGIATKKHVELAVDLGGAYSRFTATVGVLDEVKATSLVDPRLRFVVKADGKELWRSEVLTCDSAAQPVSLDVRGVKSLVLCVETEDPLDMLEYAGWGDARVVK